MQMNLKQSFLRLFLVLLILNGCSETEKTVQIYDNEDSDPPPQTIELEDSAEIIVKGKYTELLEKVNMIRSSENVKIPSEDFYYEGHVYEFIMTEVYKGEPTDVISVILPFQEIVDELHIESLEYEEPDQEKEY